VCFRFFCRLKIRWVLEGYKKKGAEKKLMEEKWSIKTPKDSRKKAAFWGISFNEIYFF